MSRLPLIEFVAGIPDKMPRPQTRGWVGYVCGILSNQPGTWARVTPPETVSTINTISVKTTGKALGLEVDAIERNGLLYMRLNND